jgi:hypothetical protein
VLQDDEKLLGWHGDESSFPGQVVQRSSQERCAIAWLVSVPLESAANGMHRFLCELVMRHPARVVFHVGTTGCAC